MDKAITGLSELTPNNFDEPRPVSPITLEVSLAYDTFFLKPMEYLSFAENV